MSKLESYFSSIKHARLATTPAHTADLTASNEFSLKLQHLDREKKTFPAAADYVSGQNFHIICIKQSNHLSYTAISWIYIKWMWKDDLSVNYTYVQEVKWEFIQFQPTLFKVTLWAAFKFIPPATKINILRHGLWSRQTLSPISGWQPLIPSQIFL